MPNDLINGMPGLKTSRTVTGRRIFLGDNGTYLPGGKVINGALARDPLNTGDLDVLRAGVLMGKITATSKYAPSVMGVTTGAYTAGGTSLTASAATVTELVRRVGSSGTFTIVGPPSANGAVASATVTYSAASGTTITITALAANYISGAFICPTDGSQTPLSFIAEEFGVKVTDIDSLNIDVPFGKFPVAGLVKSSQIVNWPSDTSLQAWIWARLNSVDAGKFIPDHTY